MLLTEALSLLSFIYRSLSLPLLLLVFVVTLALAIRRLEWGIYILFGELFVGSRGHLVEHGFISLRLVIFVAVFLGWIISEYQKSQPKADPPLAEKINPSTLLRVDGEQGRTIKNQKDNEKFKIFKELPIIYWLLLIIIVWGGIYGYLRGNGLAKVFFDANGYLYLAILPAVVSAIKSRKQIENLLKILAAAIIIIAFKTLILFVWFGFALPGVATVYHWVIEQGIGEITGLVGSASRIFMQSQFYALVGLFIFSICPSPLMGEGNKGGRLRILIIAAALFSIIMSLSRSFWLGGAAAAVFLLFAVIFFERENFPRFIRLGLTIILIGVLEIGGIFLLTKLGGGGFSQAVTSRGLNPAQESAGSARLLLLPELMNKIAQNPVFGKGFGQELTYKSYLPDRVTPENPDGEITTYAFEWGYLDTWLKIGLLGLLVYLLFIARIFRTGWERLKISNFRFQNLGLLSGLVALLTLNITTPYLNHPLGIGYIILALVSFTNLEAES